jgi:hypothetical protein
LKAVDELNLAQRRAASQQQMPKHAHTAGTDPILFSVSVPHGSHPRVDFALQRRVHSKKTAAAILTSAPCGFTKFFASLGKKCKGWCYVMYNRGLGVERESNSGSSLPRVFDLVMTQVFKNKLRLSQLRIDAKPEF